MMSKIYPRTGDKQAVYLPAKSVNAWTLWL